MVIEPSAEGNTPGDANGDGQPDLQDALVILQCVGSGNKVPSPENADVNGDGTVDLRDAMLIWQYLCGWNVELK
jgi:hypothetical protein